MKKRTMLRLSLMMSLLFALVACIDKTPTIKQPLDTQELTKNQPEEHGQLVKPEDVKLTNPLNAQWVADGKSIYDVKCSACHKLTGEKLVGPGWQGLTKRRSPDWILNIWQLEDLEQHRELMLRLADNRVYGEIDKLCDQQQHLCRNVSRHYQNHPFLMGA